MPGRTSGRVPSRRRLLLAGLGAVLAYLLVATMLTSGPVRPLFDGFAPPPEYRWLVPPPAFAAGNTPPEGVRTTIALGPDGSAARGVSTPDGQVVLTFGTGAIAPHGGDRSVRVSVTPVDGNRLRALPRGLRPNGNAYRLALTYAPSGDPVTELAKPGTLVLTVPELGWALYRDDGSAWQEVSAQPVPPRGVDLTAQLTAPGDYLDGTDLPLPPGPDPTTTDNAGWIALGIGVAAVLLIGAALLVARRRRRARISASAEIPDPVPASPGHPSDS